MAAFDSSSMIDCLTASNASIVFMVITPAGVVALLRSEAVSCSPTPDTRSMTTASDSRTTARTSVRSAVIAALAAAAATSLVNLAIASASIALGTPAVPPLNPIAYITLSVAAGVLGSVGWVIVRRRAKNPRRLLGVLAVAALIASMVPLAVFAAGTIAATGWAPIVTLALLHAATIGVAALVFSLLMPVGRTAS